MPRLALELREDLLPTDVDARLGVTAARRLFSRSPVELDREHVRLQEGAPGGAPLPDLCRFYLADGDPAALDGHPLVASVALEPPLGPPAPVFGIVDADLRSLHEAGGRGQGVTIAVLGDAGGLAPLAPAAALAGGVPAGTLADALDRDATRLVSGDILVVPFAVRTPAERAACVVAARRGILVLAAGGVAPGILSAAANDLGNLAARAACIQSLGERLPLVELIGLLAGPASESLGVLRVSAPSTGTGPAPGGRARVILRRADIVDGGDTFGTAELYFEGWVDDGERHPFRLPAEGAYPFVRDGQRLELAVILHETAAPLDGPLTVHIEAWDEDLGRDSLLDPDDLLGVHEETFTQADRWGEGLHADLPLSTRQGSWILTYEIELF